MSDEKKKPEEEDDQPSSPAWMATFADMMTLLMCFFILILSFSSMELDKFKMAMGSLQGALGTLGVQKKLLPNQSWFSPNTQNQDQLKQKSVMDHIEKMREAGLDDRAITDAALIISYFNFINRIVLGLGADLEPDRGEGYKYD